MRHLLERGERPDAVFAASDLMAVGAMRALRSAGLRVPDCAYRMPAALLVRRDLPVFEPGEDGEVLEAAVMRLLAAAGCPPDGPQ